MSRDPSESAPDEGPGSCLPDPKASASVNKKDLNHHLRCDKSTTDEVVFSELYTFSPDPLVLL
jgi:hypothetical protein